MSEKYARGGVVPSTKEQLVAKFKSEMRTRGFRWGVSVAASVVAQRWVHGRAAARQSLIDELGVR